MPQRKNMKNTLKNIAAAIGAVAIMANCSSAQQQDSRMEEEALCGALMLDISTSITRVRCTLAKLKLWREMGNSLLLDENRYREGERGIVTQANYDIDKLTVANQRIVSCNPKKNNEIGTIIQEFQKLVRTHTAPTVKTQPIRQATNRN